MSNELVQTVAITIFALVLLAGSLLIEWRKLSQNVFTTKHAKRLDPIEATMRLGPPERQGSIISHCYLHHRTGDPTVFYCNSPDGRLSVCLHGYAIIPLESIAYHDRSVLDPIEEFAIDYIERESDQ